ncbi:MAG: type II toxin-antitoxin system RelE/ParE family toxin [Candidatus Avelusimicrobium sp.]
MKNVIYYTANNGKNYFNEWLHKLDNALQQRVRVRLRRVIDGNFGDYHALAQDLYELRFANGLRIYFTQAGTELVVLFAGGNKKTQKKDIARAKELLAEFKGEL